MAQTNTDLYSRTMEKMKSYRDAHTTVSNRVIDTSIQLENLKKEHEEVLKKTALMEENFRTLDDRVKDATNQVFVSQVEPLLQEFINDIQNLTTEIQILKQLQQQNQPVLKPCTVPTSDLDTASVKSMDTARKSAGLSLRRKI
jgi:predicted transcriptional regulator